jgi:hypothetical protein
MSFRSTAWLCLIGAAACSHNNPEPTNTADDVNQINVASSEPAMTPASLETNRPATAEPTAAHPTSTSSSSSSEGSSGAHAPLAADSKSTTSPSPAPAANPAAAPKAATAPNAPAQPDNTKVNERDRNSGTQTPPDQKENESDLKITQHVRQAVMADGSLSFTAKNVKIITQNGKVTLRGPVKTAQERDAIEAATRKVAGVTQVDNQIEVKK